MSGIRFTPQAWRDLDSIEAYIALDNPDAARRLILTLREKCYFLAGHPRLVLQQPKLGSLRKYKVGNYFIFYRLVKNKV